MRPANAIIGQTDEVLFGPEQANLMRAGDLAVFDGHQRFVSEERIGGKIYLTTKIPLVHGEEATELCAITTDITPHKQAEESLRIAATVFQSGEGMCVLSPDALIVEANQAFGVLNACPAAELAGGPSRRSRSNSAATMIANACGTSCARSSPGRAKSGPGAATAGAIRPGTQADRREDCPAGLLRFADRTAEPPPAVRPDWPLPEPAWTPAPDRRPALPRHG
jgi:hypothetical protein